MAEAYVHLTIAAFACLGFFLGTFLIDLDHAGTLLMKWNCFWNPESGCSDLARGFFHQTVVAFSLIAFSICFAIGYFIHILLDYGVKL